MNSMEKELRQSCGPPRKQNCSPKAQRKGDQSFGPFQSVVRLLGVLPCLT
jgi:hypothetical protein